MRKTLEKTLDQILEKALEKALASLEERAAALIAVPLEEALRRRVEAWLASETALEVPEAPTRARARARVVAAAVNTAAPTEAVPTEAPKPRARRAKEAAAQAPSEDLETTLEAAAVALVKYKGAFTPKGKPLEEVLARRLRKTLQYAQALGRSDLKALAKAALALIDSNPKGYAMASWEKLAESLGLPVPSKQEVSE